MEQEAGMDLSDPARNAVPRAVLTGLCISTCALLGLFAARFAMGPRGATAPALLDTLSPAVSASVAFALLAVAVAFACALARPINAAVSLFCVGCGVAAYAMRCGSVSDAVFQGAGFRWFGAETLGWGAFVAAVSVAVFRVGGPLPDVPALDAEQSFLAGLRRPRALASLLAALAAPLLLVFTLVGASKGQAIGACTLAGVATAFVARLIAPREQPVLLFAAPCVAIGVAQLVLAGPAMASLDARFASGTLSPILCAMPADVAAGSLCGVAIGLGWSRGLVKRGVEN